MRVQQPLGLFGTWIAKAEGYKSRHLRKQPGWKGTGMLMVVVSGGDSVFFCLGWLMYIWGGGQVTFLIFPRGHCIDRQTPPPTLTHPLTPPHGSIFSGRGGREEASPGNRWSLLTGEGAEPLLWKDRELALLSSLGRVWLSPAGPSVECSKQWSAAAPASPRWVLRLG